MIGFFSSIIVRFLTDDSFSYYRRTLSDASMLYFADVFFHLFFMPALVGQTAERIFTKLSHVVDIGLSHARPNSGISGDLLSENEAKPAVI